MIPFALAQELKNAGFSPSSAVPPSPALNSLRPIGQPSSRFIGSLPISTPGSRAWTRYQGVCEGVYAGIMGSAANAASVLARCRHVVAHALLVL
jgi:hypothetical protein